MKTQSPVVSIIMATYNRGHLIGETLRSISAQSFENWECLIIDDGSSDNTGEILGSFLLDQRFKYFRRTSKYHKGLPGCRNQGIDLAFGNYFIFFDDDDIVHPENLKTCLENLQNNSYSFCRYNKQPFYNNLNYKEFTPVKNYSNSYFHSDRLEEMVTGKIPFASCCVMWNRKCFKNISFNEELMYSEEWECYSRILAAGFEGISIDAVLYYNRKHIKSNTGEFHQNNTSRVSSKVKSAKLIIENLSSKNLLSKNLEIFFIRLGLNLKSKEIIKVILEKRGSGKIKKMKYHIGFLFYPVLRPFFKLKAKIFSS